MKCIRCGTQVDRDGRKRCDKCQSFVKRFGDVPPYLGEVRCGDTFEGHHGFVWGVRRGWVGMYCQAGNGDETYVATLSERELRARIARRYPNGCGTLVLPKRVTG